MNSKSTSSWKSNRTTGGDLRVLHGVDSFQIDSRRGNMGLEWSWVVSAGV